MTSPVAKVAATPAALEAIQRLRAEKGALVFFQSGGCCEGSVPLCLTAGELIVDAAEPTGTDVLLGEVGGCGFYMDRRQYETWKRTQLVLDVGEGEPEGFSLGAGPGAHFLVRSRAFSPGELAELGIEPVGGATRTDDPGRAGDRGEERGDGARIPRR